MAQIDFQPVNSGVDFQPTGSGIDFQPIGGSQKQSPIQEGQDISNTVLENAGNMATLGYLPQIEAKAQPLTTRLSNILRSKQTQEAPWSQLTENGPEFIKARDQAAQDIADESARNPKSAFLGKALGVVGPAVLAPEMLGVQAAKGIGQAALRGTAYGAGMGALQNPGDTKGQSSDLQLLERAKNAGVGAATGLGVSTILNPATTNYLGSKIYDSGIKKLIQRGSDYGKEDVGPLLRKMGIWGSPESINQEVGAAKGPIWSKVQGAMSDAESAGANFDMDRAMQKAQDSVDQIRAKRIPSQQPIADRLEEEIAAHKKMQPDTRGSDEFPAIGKEQVPLPLALEAKSAVNEMTPQSSWNVNQKSPAFKKVTEPLRQGLHDEISGQVEGALGPEARAEFEQNNSDYGKLATIKPAANQAAKVEMNKNMVTPVDMALLAAKPKIELLKKIGDAMKSGGVRTSLGYGMTQAAPAAEPMSRMLLNPNLNPWEQTK